MPSVKIITKEQLDADCSNGLSKSDIAKKYLCSRNRINRLLNKYNLQPINGLKSENFKNKMSSITRERWQDQEFIEKRRAISTELWKDESYRNNIIATKSTDDFRQILSEKSKNAFASNEKRAEHAEITKSQYVNNPKRRSEQSEYMKKSWKNCDFRHKQIEAHSSDDYKSKIAKLYSDPSYKDKISKMAKKVWENKEYREKMAIIRSQQPTSLTKPHKKVCNILDSLGVVYQIEYTVGFYNFDVFIPSANILIEVQGNYWHNLKDNASRDKAKSTYVSQYFPNYRLFYVWEHECLQPDRVAEKIKYWLGLSKEELVDYDFSSLIIKQADRLQIDEFLYSWHYQHHGRHGFDVSAYLDNQLVCVARFTNPTRAESATSLGYSQKEVLELARLCVHPRYQKKNLLSWFLARVEKIVRLDKPNIKCLISFADSTFNHTGAVYKAANWDFSRIVEPDYWYVDQQGYVMHKRTLWSHSNSLKMSESNYASMYGYSKVFGSEKYKFIKKLI